MKKPITFLMFLLAVGQEATAQEVSGQQLPLPNVELNQLAPSAELHQHYSECGTPPDNAYLFGHPDDEGAIVLRTSCYAEYADCGDAVRNSTAACLRLRCEPF